MAIVFAIMLGFLVLAIWSHKLNLPHWLCIIIDVILFLTWCFTIWMDMTGKGPSINNSDERSDNYYGDDPEDNKPRTSSNGY